MSKYLELVEGSFNESHFNKQTSQNPYVAYSIEDDKVVYSIVTKPVVNDSWLTFTAEEANSTIRLAKLSTNQTLEYSTDTTTWNTFDTTTNISLNNGDKVYVRGLLSNNNSSGNFTQFKMTGKIAASGNCNAIWNYQDLKASLKAYCGYSMFDNCASLTTAPELPATELADSCYYGMFGRCTYLTTAPELPATELAYASYSYMFQYCTSLTTSPELPATKLADNCCRSMFKNCTSLTTAPELPATELADSCYNGMFENCTSITTVPELPATELANYCYGYMFNGCTNLNYIKCLATTITPTYCTSNWVKGVSSTGTFVKHPNMSKWTTSANGIPSGWTVVNAEV